MGMPNGTASAVFKTAKFAALLGALADVQQLPVDTGLGRGTPSKRYRKRNAADSARGAHLAKAKRRKANKVARASRRVNRGRAR